MKMKLRNKRTGDIWEFDDGFSMKASQETAERAGAKGGSLTCFANSLAKLNEEWEDYEEPKEVWYIDFQGVVRSASKEENDWFKENEIGNYFETKEEAEKAVEKLKAWKRLRDKGFKFNGETCDYKADKHFGSVFFETDGYLLDVYEDTSEFYDDLDLLFGGEE